MKINKYNIQLNNNNSIVFFAPEKDSVVPGTIAGLKENNWKLNKIDFKQNDIFVV